MNGSDEDVRVQVREEDAPERVLVDRRRGTTRETAQNASKGSRRRHQSSSGPPGSRQRHEPAASSADAPARPATAPSANAPVTASAPDERDAQVEGDARVQGAQLAERGRQEVAEPGVVQDRAREPGLRTAGARSRA